MWAKVTLLFCVMSCLSHCSILSKTFDCDIMAPQHASLCLLNAIRAFFSIMPDHSCASEHDHFNKEQNK